MSKSSKVRCDKCGKEGSGTEVLYWHYLQLTERDFDSIPPRAVPDRLDFCSLVCLQEFVAALKVDDSPYARVR